MPRVGPESPDLGDAQIGSESPVPGEAKKESTSIRPRWGTKSPGLGEAQVVIRVPGSRRGPGKDQIHQVEEAHVGTCVPRYGGGPGGNPTHQVQVRPTCRPCRGTMSP